MSAAFHIRPFQPSDLHRLQEMTAAAFDGVSIDQGIERVVGPVAGRDWRWRKMRHVSDDAARDPAGLLVAVDPRGGLLGYVSTWCDTAGGIGHIPNLVVDASWRGQGIGRALLHAALERFRAAGLHAAKIETLVQNQVGQQLYESVGFREAARQIHYIQDLRTEPPPDA